MTTKPRACTEDEVRAKLIEHIEDLIDYWATLPDKTVEDRLHGVAFSILVTLDGESADLPGFIVAPAPHPDDQEFLRKQGENWFPYSDYSKIACDVSGALHDTLARRHGQRQRGEEVTS